MYSQFDYGFNGGISMSSKDAFKADNFENNLKGFYAGFCGDTFSFLVFLFVIKIPYVSVIYQNYQTLLLPFRFFPPFFLLVHLVKELFPLISRPFFVFVFWRGIVHIHSPAPCCDPLRRAVFHFLPFFVCRFVRVVVRVARIFFTHLLFVSNLVDTNDERREEKGGEKSKKNPKKKSHKIKAH